MPPAASSFLPKRARTSSTSKSSSGIVNYHSKFPKTDQSDLILKSSDDVHFATRKVYLLAASQVFEDTLLVGEEGAKVDGLPIIKLEETGRTLALFLPFVQTSPVVSRGTITKLTSLDSLLLACDKYDVPLSGRSIASHYFTLLLDQLDTEEDVGIQDALKLPGLFALALLHLQFGTEVFVRRSIRLMGWIGEWNDIEDLVLANHSRAGAKELVDTTSGWRPFGLEDIPVSYLRRMDPRDVYELSRVRTKVILDAEYGWREAANDFKIHGTS